MSRIDVLRRIVLKLILQKIFFPQARMLWDAHDVGLHVEIPCGVKASRLHREKCQCRRAPTECRVQDVDGTCVADARQSFKIHPENGPIATAMMVMMMTIMMMVVMVTMMVKMMVML